MKTITKKVAAVAVGAILLGSTLVGAASGGYDLAQYPQPFIKDGRLDNTVIVVGEAAKASDVLGAIDIAAALQADAVTVSGINTGSVSPIVSEGKKVQKSGDKLNYGDGILDVYPEGFDEQDLPTVLGERNFKDSKGENRQDRTYTQTLTFGSGAFDFVLAQPDDEDAGNYVRLERNDRAYNYTMEFRSPVVYATNAIANDFEGTTIEIQGKVYTINEARGTDGVLNRIKLLAGDSVVWLTQDQPYTLGEHTITVVDVNNNAEKCGINVDGVTRWVDVGSTVTVQGVSIGILDAVAVNTRNYDADACEIVMGSSQIVLEHGEMVSVNNQEFEGSEVSFIGSAGQWRGFSITYTAGREDQGANSDDIYLEEGDAWTDPVLGNWKVMYEGITADFENMSFRSSGDDAEFRYTNNDGKEVVIPFHYTGSQIILGSDSDEPLLLPGTSYSGNPEGVLLLYTTSGGETHVLEIDDLSCGSRNRTTIKDLTYASTVAKDRDLANGCEGSWETISLGSLGSIKLNITQGSIAYDAVSNMGNGKPESIYGANLTFESDAVHMTESAGDEQARSTISLSLSWDAGDDDIKIGTVKGGVSGNTSMLWVDSAEKDSDTQLAVTPKGTMLTYDADDKLRIDISHPEEDVIANLFIAPVSANVLGQDSIYTSEQVNPFTVGLAVLDNSAMQMDRNMIVVGGPCANRVAAELMGNPASCTAGFSEGRAMIKYFDRKGKAALLVAGHSAQDTQGAAFVLADYDKYDLAGDEVDIIVGSLRDISVSPV
jgi:hypothetical protein